MQSFIIHTCIIFPIGYAFKELSENLDLNRIITNLLNITKLEKNEKEFVFFIILLLISILSYLLTIYIIPVMKIFSIKANLFGYDINKKGSKEGEIKIP